MRGVAKYNDTGGNVDVGNHHVHDAEEGRQEVLKMLSKVREDAKTSSAPPSAIYQQRRQEVSVKAAPGLPSEDAMRQIIQRSRRRNLPAEPQSRGEVTLPPSLKMTQNGQDFLLFDTFDDEDEELGAEDGKDRILAFATQRNLELLAESDIWFMDGTFKTSPTLFAQLYTINASQDGLSFPLVYGLLPSKSRLTYESFLRELVAASQRSGVELQPRHIMLDFEYAAIQAVKTIFPDAALHACLFHGAEHSSPSAS